MGAAILATTAMELGMADMGKPATPAIAFLGVALFLKVRRLGGTRDRDAILIFALFGAGAGNWLRARGAAALAVAAAGAAARSVTLTGAPVF